MTGQGELFGLDRAAGGQLGLGLAFEPSGRDLGADFQLRSDNGARGLDEAEALALLLARCSPLCAHPVATAQALLGHFGCWPRVMGATTEELAGVTGAATAADLRLVRDLMLRGLEFEVRKRSVLSSWEAVRAYLRASLGGQARESFRVLFLDKASQLILDALMGEGTVDHAPVYPREVMRRALELNASACCLVHNHPTGGSTPSTADVEVTKRVVEADRAIGIAVHDHFLVGGDQVVSFRALGLI